MSHKLKFALIGGKDKNYYQNMMAHLPLPMTPVNLSDIPWPGLFALRSLWPRFTPSEIAAASHFQIRVGYYRYPRASRVQHALRRWWFGFRTHLNAVRYLDYLRQRDFDCVIMWNGLHINNQAMKLACRALGIKTLFLENGLLPNTTTIDPQGVNYGNSVPRERSFYEALPPRPLDEDLRQLVPRKPVQPKPGAHEVELPAHYIFIPFQVESDTQILLYSPWIRNMRHLFEVIRAIAETPALQKYHFIFKEHPTSYERYPDLHEQVSERVYFANGNSTQQLIERADVVITVNSTVGIEALLYHKKVITLGQAFFDIAGICSRADGEQKLRDVLVGADNWLVDAGLIDKFIGYLRYEYLVEGGWREPTPAHWQSLQKHIEALTAQG